MKKILIAAALLVTFGLASCGNDPEARAEEYVEKMVKATKEGDQEKLRELQVKEAAYINTLSEEEMRIYEEGARKASEKHAKELLGM